MKILYTHKPPLCPIPMCASSWPKGHGGAGPHRPPPPHPPPGFGLDEMTCRKREQEEMDFTSDPSWSSSDQPQRVRIGKWLCLMAGRVSFVSVRSHNSGSIVAAGQAWDPF